MSKEELGANASQSLNSLDVLFNIQAGLNARKGSSDQKLKAVLSLAIPKNETEVITAVFAKESGLVNANLAAKNQGFCSPLHLAVLEAPLETVKLIAKAGADLEALKLPERQTALMVAVENNDTESAEFLMKEGAKLNVRNAQGKSIVDLAMEANWPENLIYLMKDKLDIELAARRKAVIDAIEHLGVRPL